MASARSATCGLASIGASFPSGGSNSCARASVGRRATWAEARRWREPFLAHRLPIERVVVESLIDLRASKITCLLSRVEPRDLVDLLFLERSGFSVEKDLELALRKDSGIDPGVLAWLMRDFATEPLPAMLQPLSVHELRAFRDDLAERLRRVATG